MDDAGTYMFSGFDGSVLSFLLGGEEITTKSTNAMPTMEEIIDTAFNQEVLAMVN
jgi:hypothetical protein